MFAHEKLGFMLIIGTMGLAMYLLLYHMVTSRVAGKKLDQTKSRGESRR